MATRPLRVVVVTIEAVLSPFSGNGMLASSYLRGISGSAHVLVICGCPASTPPGAADEAASALGVEAIVPIPLPSWGRLDRECAWPEFRRGLTECGVLEALTRFDADVVCALDYHAGLAWETCGTALRAAGSRAATAPFGFASMRCFSTTTMLHGPSGGSADTASMEGAASGSAVSDAALAPLCDRTFFQAAEAYALGRSEFAVALCRTDALSFAALALGVDPLNGEAVPAAVTAAYAHGRALRAAALAARPTAALPEAPVPADAPLPRMAVLLPPLRETVAQLAREAGGSVPAAGGPAAAGADVLPGHRAVLSALRLSPEKAVDRVPPLLAALHAARPALLPSRRLQPVLCGSAGHAEYAEGVRGAFRAALGGAPSVPSPAAAASAERSEVDAAPAPRPPPPSVLSRFLGPADMVALFSQTALNLHACSADAYGMTVVEAAACGAPSVVHVPGYRASSGARKAPASADSLPASKLFVPVGVERELSSGGGIATPGGAGAVAAPSRDGSSVAGCLELQLAALLRDAAPFDVLLAVGRQLITAASGLPPVGACDLLAPAIMESSGSGSGKGDDAAAGAAGKGSGSYDPPCAIIPFDWEAPVEGQVTQLLPWLEGGDGPGSPLHAVASRARSIAMSWTEKENGAALLTLLKDAARAVAGR